MHGRFRKDLINSREGKTSLDARLDELTTLLNSAQAEINSIKNGNTVLDHMHLNTSIETEPTEVGAFYWSDIDRTANLNMNENVTQSIGQELYAPRCVNKTGSDILNGEVVYVSGVQGNRIALGLADSTSYAKTHKLIGMATENIANNNEGFVTTHGYVRGLNTSAYDEGDCLFLSNIPGQVVVAKPADGLFRVRIGMVVKSHVTDGWINIHINEDHYMFGDRDSGNYSYFEEDGTMVMVGNATGWEDIDFPIIIRTTGANIPTLVEVQDGLTAPQWQVNDTNMCEGTEFIHGWKEGSEVRWHIHMITNGTDASNRYVKWQIDWFWVNVNGQIPTSISQSVEYEIPADTPDKTMLIVPLYQWTPTGGKIAGHVYPKLTRIAAAGTAPSNNPWCTMLQMHVECDTIRSRAYQTK